MKILVTGANGFTANYLITLLSGRRDAQLIYTDLSPRKEKDWHVCDLSDFDAARRLIEETRPDQIYHLAGTLTNDYSTDYRGNVLITKNIFDGILSSDLKCRVLIIGSSAEYGTVSKSEDPVTERYPLNPVSIYGLTKVYQSHLMKFYFTMHKMDIIMARTFNLLGKGMSHKLFIGRLCKGIDEYKKGNISKIKLGNLNNKRDYIDVKDAVRYYELIMNRGSSGEIYNVGTGTSTRIYDILQGILKENGLSINIVGENIISDPNKIDISDICANISKLLSLKDRRFVKV